MMGLPTFKASGGGGRDPSDDFWYTGIGTRSEATTADVLGLSVVGACVDVISQSTGQLPIGVFSRAANGDKVAREEHPVYDLLQWQANDEQTGVEFRESMAAYAVTRGTGVAEIVPGARGAIGQLIPYHPDNVRAVRTEDSSGRGRWDFEIHSNGVPTRRLLREDAFVIRGLMANPDCPILGIDPLTAHSGSFGAAVGLQQYGKNFVENDARPPGILTHPSHFNSADDRNLFLRAWHFAFGGPNRGKTPVLEHGMTYTSIAVTPEQAQVLETRKYTDVDIARIFRVPPHKVGILDRATFSNIEHQSLEFVTDTLMPWLIRWEQSVRRDLFTSDAFFFEHNVNGLLRADTKTRFQAYALGRSWGWLSVNDIRRLENQPSIGPAGDVYLEPVNMTPAGTAPDDGRGTITTEEDQ